MARSKRRRKGKDSGLDGREARKEVVSSWAKKSPSSRSQENKGRTGESCVQRYSTWYSGTRQGTGDMAASNSKVGEGGGGRLPPKKGTEVELAALSLMSLVRDHNRTHMLTGLGARYPSRPLWRTRYMTGQGHRAHYLVQEPEGRKQCPKGCGGWFSFTQWSLTPPPYGAPCT
jgi:hypothetical protein